MLRRHAGNAGAAGRGRDQGRCDPVARTLRQPAGRHWICPPSARPKAASSLQGGKDRWSTGGGRFSVAGAGSVIGVETTGGSFISAAGGTAGVFLTDMATILSVSVAS
jgi:hypothetical protein